MAVSMSGENQIERMTGHMLKLHNRLTMGLTFQKMKERRMQVLWLNRVKELKNQCENLSLSQEERMDTDSLVTVVVDMLTKLQGLAQGHARENELFHFIL